MPREIVELAINMGGTVFGGVIFTLLLFVFNEFIFPKKNISGEWDVTETAEDSSLNRFIGMEMKSKFHLLQKGYDIDGSGEKVSEKEIDKEEYAYEHKNRVTIDLSGYMERRFFGKSQVYMHIITHGKERESRASYILDVVNKNKLEGILLSTAANTKGVVTLRRTNLS